MEITAAIGSSLIGKGMYVFGYTMQLQLFTLANDLSFEFHFLKVKGDKKG